MKNIFASFLVSFTDPAQRPAFGWGVLSGVMVGFGIAAVVAAIF